MKKIITLISLTSLLFSCDNDFNSKLEKLLINKTSKKVKITTDKKLNEIFCILKIQIDNKYLKIFTDKELFFENLYDSNMQKVELVSKDELNQSMEILNVIKKQDIVKESFHQIKYEKVKNKILIKQNKYAKNDFIIIVDPLCSATVNQYNEIIEKYKDYNLSFYNVAIELSYNQNSLKIAKWLNQNPKKNNLYWEKIQDKKFYSTLVYLDNKEVFNFLNKEFNTFTSEKEISEFREENLKFLDTNLIEGTPTVFLLN